MGRSRRISYLADLLKGFDCVIDIGTDHGLVLKEAFEKQYIKKAIATDINKDPLKSAKKNLKHEQAIFIESDGFKNVYEPFDACIIAGMGAFLICDILKDAPKNDAYYILQPNDKVEHLRAFLSKNGFMITDEHVIFDKFYYVILIVKRGHMTLNERELILGPYLKQKQEAIAYYQYKIEKMSQFLHKVDEKRSEEIKKLIRIYNNYD